jgi:hypothetical protein
VSTYPRIFVYGSCPTVTLLHDGQVLVTWTSTLAELYDPIAGTFSATGSMLTTPVEGAYSQTLLANGTVLVAGGLTVPIPGSLDVLSAAVDTAEVYEPSTGAFRLTGKMKLRRARHTANRLDDGTVLVTGASQEGWGAFANTEVYDPNTGTFSPRATLATPRYFHTATLLDRGKVLVAGGLVDEQFTTTTSAELYDSGFMATRGQFPPHDETLRFRQVLEAYYRDTLKRPLQRTYVDVNSDVSWIRKYVRYRLTTCPHEEATRRVRMEIGGARARSGCGDSAPSFAFPPRSEILAFRRDLEQTYRDELRRALTATSVDAEGVAAWLAEYLRYRVSACSHRDAVSKVMLKIQGISPPATCQ